MIIGLIMENFEEKEEKLKYEGQIKSYAAKKGLPYEKEKQLVEDLKHYLKPYEKPVGVDFIPPKSIYTMNYQLTRELRNIDENVFRDDEGEENNTAYLEDTEELDPPNSRPHSNATSRIAIIKHWLDKAWNHRLRHRSVFAFGPKNRFRLFLQHFVASGTGKRIEGVEVNKRRRWFFTVFIQLTILASVIVAVITTPVWRHQQSQMEPEDRSNIVDITDTIFIGIFTFEFLVRVIADGFILTPDAYLRTLWHQIDFFVLLSLYAPMVAKYMKWSSTSRFFRSLKALRALRLINGSDYIKETFHAVLIAGFPQLLDAAMLCMALLVPFAIYGMRLFSGRFFSCNDVSGVIQVMDQCTGTFQHMDLNITMPRVWANPHEYSFNNFWAAILVLLEIVSQDGWVKIMETARNIMGLANQPYTDAYRYSGIFFILFNLAGAYFVVSLFIAIVIANYNKRTGTAYMSVDQLRWKNMRQFLRHTRAKRTILDSERSYSSFANKRGWFARTLTVVTILIGIVLATENLFSGIEMYKNWFFLAFLLVYMFEAYAKVRGLGWRSYRRKRWNIYNAVISFIALLATAMVIGGWSWQLLIQLQKLLLTAILLRLIPGADGLNRLVMTML